MGKPKKLDDGGMMVFCDVEDAAGPETDGEEPLARAIRMIFAPGTPAEEALNIPQVNLNALYTAIEKAGTTQMIVVAVKEID